MELSLGRLLSSPPLILEQPINITSFFLHHDLSSHDRNFLSDPPRGNLWHRRPTVSHLIWAEGLSAARSSSSRFFRTGCIVCESSRWSGTLSQTCFGAFRIAAQLKQLTHDDLTGDTLTQVVTTAYMRMTGGDNIFFEIMRDQNASLSTILLRPVHMRVLSNVSRLTVTLDRDIDAQVYNVGSARMSLAQALVQIVRGIARDCMPPFPALRNLTTLPGRAIADGRSPVRLAYGQKAKRLLPKMGDYHLDLKHAPQLQCIVGHLDHGNTAEQIFRYARPDAPRSFHIHLDRAALDAVAEHVIGHLPLPRRIRHIQVSFPVMEYSDNIHVSRPTEVNSEKIKRRKVLECLIAELKCRRDGPILLEVLGWYSIWLGRGRETAGRRDDGLQRKVSVNIEKATTAERFAPETFQQIDDRTISMTKTWRRGNKKWLSCKPVFRYQSRDEAIDALTIPSDVDYTAHLMRGEVFLMFGKIRSGAHHCASCGLALASSCPFDQVATVPDDMAPDLSMENALVFACAVPAAPCNLTPGEWDLSKPPAYGSVDDLGYLRMCW